MFPKSESAPPLILASASRARAAMFEAAGVDIALQPAAVDEGGVKLSFKAAGGSAGEAAVALAELKAGRVAAGVMPEAIVLGADQILTCEGAWFDKPTDREAAREQLERLAGKPHELHTAVVAFRGGARIWHHLTLTRLWMRPLSAGFLDDYLDAIGDAVLETVGGYHIERLGPHLFSRIDGDHFSILGLPLLPTLAFLRDQGGAGGMTDGTYLTGSAKLAGVMGWPVSHSRSPRLHGYWLRHYDLDGIYVPLAVEPGYLEPAVRGLHALGFQGCNLTIPHKEAVFPLVDELTETARRVGAVNTLIIGEDGRLRGDNTDGFGFTASLKAGAQDWQAADGPAVLLGAGGAARAIAVALLDAGTPTLQLVNRTRERAERLADALRPMATGRSIEVIAWEERAGALAGANLLVNTTSLGMSGQPPLDIALDDLPRSATVTDIVYAPLETDLLAVAGARGNTVVDGLGMLLHQARPGFAAWFGVDPKVTDALRRTVLGG